MLQMPSIKLVGGLPVIYSKYLLRAQRAKSEGGLKPEQSSEMPPPYTQRLLACGRRESRMNMPLIMRRRWTWARWGWQAGKARYVKYIKPISISEYSNRGKKEESGYLKGKFRGDTRECLGLYRQAEAGICCHCLTSIYFIAFRHCLSFSSYKSFHYLLHLL